MFRQESISELLICTVKIFLGEGNDGPYYKVFTDADTECVGYFESAAARGGDQVLPAFSAWTRESLKRKVIEHAQQRAGLSADEAEALAEQIANCLAGREMNST